MNPLTTQARLILILSVLVLGAGVALAVVQPGNLGDDEETATSDTSLPFATSSTTTASSAGGDSTSSTADTTGSTASTDSTLPGDTSTTSFDASTSTAVPASTATTVAPQTDTTLADSSTATTIVASGVGGAGGADAGGDDIANTGAESLLFIGGGLLLAALGVAGRRAVRLSV